MKFKVGDRVKVINLQSCYHDYDTLRIGMEGNVIEDGSNRPWVEFDENIGTTNVFNGSKKGHTMCMWENEIELISSEQFTKSDLQDGDIVTYRDRKRKTKIGYRFSDKNSYLLLDDFNEDLTTKSNMKHFDIIKVERPTQYETVFERKEEILNEKEREYLSTAIKPYKANYIEKRKSILDDKLFIKIHLDDDKITLPYFEEGTIYNGMKTNKKYTLQELGL